MLPAHSFNWPSASVASAADCGQVAVLDDLYMPLREHHVANSLHRVTLADDLRRHLAVSHQVMPDQGCVTQIRQRIVDLDIEKMLDSALLGVTQTAASHERRDGTTMTVRAERK